MHNISGSEQRICSGPTGYSLWVVILTLTVPGLLNAQSIDWVARKNGYAMETFSVPVGIAVDSNGRVYVAARAFSNSNADYLTLSYASDGTLLWGALRNGPANVDDVPAALATNGNGVVAVTGNTGINTDFFTVAYDSSGQELWARTKNGPDALQDNALAVAVDAGGKVYVTGNTLRQVFNDFFNSCMTVAYDSAGNELWTGFGPQLSTCHSVAVGSDGKVFVAGQVGGAAGKYLVIAYDQVGNELWVAEKLSGNPSSFWSPTISLGGNGLVYLSASFWNGADLDFLTVAYDTDGNELWAVLKDDAGVGGGSAEAAASATDADGNVYVTGFSDGHPLTVTYDSAGNELWDAIHGGTGYAQAIAVTSDGRVIVTGCSSGAPCEDYLTVAYDSGGNELWAETRDGEGEGSDAAVGVAVGQDGVAFVAGSSKGLSLVHTLTVAYGGSGSELWSAREPDTAVGNDRPGSGEPVRGKGALALDGQGNVFVTGRSWNGTDDDFLTVGYDDSGTELWAKFKNAGGNEQAHALALGGNGNVYAVGQAPGGGFWDFLTVAYDSTGAELWAKTKSTAGNSVDQAYAVAVGSSGNIYVTGRSLGSATATYDYLTVAYDSAGTELWAKIKNGAGNNYDEARAIAVSGNGNIHVTGFGRSAVGADDFLTVTYDAAGTELWARTKSGPGNNHDEARALAVAVNGNVYVTGSAWNGADLEFLTVAYNSAGTELWAKVKNRVAFGDDEAYDIAVDDSGNVYVTGSSRDDTDSDFLTVAYDSAGNELWAKAKDGPAHFDDVAYAVDVDSGIIHVTGSSYNSLDTDYLTVAYDSAGNELWALPVDGAGRDDVAYAIAVDPAGGVIVSGWSHLLSDDFYTARIVYDTTAPSDPTLLAAQPPHVQGGWSNQASITMEWSGAVDNPGGSGLAGYSVEWNTTAVSTPDSVVDVIHGDDPHSFMASPGEGANRYFHLRSCDVQDNCTATLHRGPFGIDLNPPSTPGAVNSSSHGDGQPHADSTIDIAWGAATDGLSGIDGYSYTFDHSAVSACETTKDVEEATLSAISAALGDGTWYAHVCAVDHAGNWGPVVHGGPYVIDTSGPTGLLVNSTSHSVTSWSGDPTVDFTFSGANDPSGVAGYSRVFNQAATTVPDTNIDQAGTTFTGTANPDASNWYLHVRACDNVGNCGPTVHFGPLWIDTAAPSAPGAVNSPSHGNGQPHADDTIDINWAAATDGLSGIDGYSFYFDSNTASACETTKDVEEGTLSASSAPLPAGTWYVHVCAVDHAGNWGPVVHGGPYQVVSDTLLRSGFE